MEHCRGVVFGAPAYAEHSSSLPGLFFPPLNQEFGWSRTAVSSVQSIARLMEGIVALFLGPLVDRQGPRRLMLAGGTLAGLCFLLVMLVTVLWQFHAVRGVLLALSVAMMGRWSRMPRCRSGLFGGEDGPSPLRGWGRTWRTW